MRRLHVLLPMGGLGSRFAEKGWTLPKPVISVGGVPMFRRALSGLDGLGAPTATTAVFRRETEESGGLTALLKAIDPSISVVILPAPTRGAAETCAAALDLVAPDDGVLSLDCDLEFQAPAFLDLLRRSLSGNGGPACGGPADGLDGALAVFPSTAARYSYARSEGGRVVETAEKRPISGDAILGAYHFSRGDLFASLVHELLSRPPEGEYYLSHLFSLLLGRGGRVETARTETFLSYGTPEELEAGGKPA